MTSIVKTPADQARLGVQFIERMHAQRDRAMPILLPGEISDYVPNVLPGELVVIEAQTHNGKSLFMDLWARRYIQHLRSKGRDDEIVVWIDTEQPVDYLATSQVAALTGLTDFDVMHPQALDMTKLMNAANRMADSGMYVIATQLGDDDGGQEVHLTNIKKGLQMLQGGQIDGTAHKIAAIFCDYLQSLPIDPSVRKAGIEQQRRLQVARDVDTLRRMASLMDCPVIVGVQAKQELASTSMSRSLRLPTIYDGQETSNIAQRPDRIFSLAVASRSFDDGEIITYKNNRFAVREGLLFVAVLKQRKILSYRRSGDVFAFEIQPDTSDPMAALKRVWSGWVP